jgi:hypothetical protein
LFYEPLSYASLNVGLEPCAKNPDSCHFRMQQCGQGNSWTIFRGGGSDHFVSCQWHVINNAPPARDQCSQTAVTSCGIPAGSPGDNCCWSAPNCSNFKSCTNNADSYTTDQWYHLAKFTLEQDKDRDGNVVPGNTCRIVVNDVGTIAKYTSSAMKTTKVCLEGYPSNDQAVGLTTKCDDNEWTRWTFTAVS